ncbi:hypothetical protein, partial [Comamonas thiooxydans]|uniref:hypothetical protein n=1 Tax=Comamonas thiooxydans TaxID=363952 RepID=UPI00196A051C
TQGPPKSATRCSQEQRVFCFCFLIYPPHTSIGSQFYEHHLLKQCQFFNINKKLLATHTKISMQA